MSAAPSPPPVAQSNRPRAPDVAAPPGTTGVLLRNLSLPGKLGVAGLLLVFGIGLLASLKHIETHYQNRDERPGLTRDDITAAYAGLRAPSALLEVARGRHPSTPGGTVVVPDSLRTALEKWLASPQIAENFDSMEFSDPTARELVAASCASCHSMRADPGTPGLGRAASIPLDTWEQVKRYAFERTLERTPDRVKTISTHTHALSLATMGAVLLVLAMLSTWPRWLTGLCVCVMGLGLAADISGWWLTNHYAWAVNLIIVGGAGFSGGSGLLLLLSFFELFKPRRA
ncbi:MAG: hypothetical protein AB7K52_14475 [Phycisphaerales bacterium]